MGFQYRQQGRQVIFSAASIHCTLILFAISYAWKHRRSRELQVLKFRKLKYLSGMASLAVTFLDYYQIFWGTSALMVALALYSSRVWVAIPYLLRSTEYAIMSNNDLRRYRSILRKLPLAYSLLIVVSYYVCMCSRFCVACKPIEHAFLISLDGLILFCAIWLLVHIKWEFDQFQVSKELHLFCGLWFIYVVVSVLMLVASWAFHWDRIQFEVYGSLLLLSGVIVVSFVLPQCRATILFRKRDSLSFFSRSNVSLSKSFRTTSGLLSVKQRCSSKDQAKHHESSSRYKLGPGNPGPHSSVGQILVSSKAASGSPVLDGFSWSEPEKRGAMEKELGPNPLVSLAVQDCHPSPHKSKSLLRRVFLNSRHVRSSGSTLGSCSSVATFASSSRLARVLKSPSSVEKLMKFAEKSFCPENVLFPLQCMEFWSLLDQKYKEGGVNYQYYAFKHISDKFIKDGAPYEVNVSSSVRDQILNIATSLEAFTASSSTAPATVLEAAFCEVEQMLWANYTMSKHGYQLTPRQPAAFSLGRAKKQWFAWRRQLQRQQNLPRVAPAAGASNSNISKMQPAKGNQQLAVPVPRWQQPSRQRMDTVRSPDIRMCSPALTVQFSIEEEDSPDADEKSAVEALLYETL